MTELEKKLMAMTPEDRKKAVEYLSSQMGMDPRIIEENRKRRMAEQKAKRKKKRMDAIAKRKAARFLLEDERRAVTRFVDQPGQWIDTTPPEVKARQKKALKELEEMMKNDKEHQERIKNDKK